MATVHVLRDSEGRALAYTVFCPCGYAVDRTDRAIADADAARHNQTEHR